MLNPDLTADIHSRGIRGARKTGYKPDDRNGNTGTPLCCTREYHVTLSYSVGMKAVVMKKIKGKELQEPADPPAGGKVVEVAMPVTLATAVTETEKKPGQKRKN